MVKKKKKYKKRYFKTLREARIYQKKHKRKYGYRPSLFTKYRGKKVESRLVVIPKGLKKL